MKTTWLILGMLCLIFSTTASGQGPNAPSQVWVCVTPDSGVVNQDTLVVPLSYPIQDQQGNNLSFNFDVNIHLLIDLVSTTNVSKIHVEVSEDIGGMPMVHLNTSFDLTGSGNIYATQLQNGNQIDLQLAQNHMSEVDYKVWLEDSQGNLSSIVSASSFHFID